MKIVQPVWQLGLDGLLTKKYLVGIENKKVYLRTVKDPKANNCGLHDVLEKEIGKTLFFKYQEAKRIMKQRI